VFKKSGNSPQETTRDGLGREVGKGARVDREGKSVRQEGYLYGYKTHVSVNEETELITSVEVTSGNGPGGKQMPSLV
jgi:hypothetical protein